MEKCKACNTKVEPGAVRCVSCGADLTLPGAFPMTISFVLIGVAAIPLGISVPFLFKLAKGEGIGREGELIPLVIAAVLLIVGVGIFISARMRSKMAERPTIKDEEEAGAQG